MGITQRGGRPSAPVARGQPDRRSAPRPLSSVVLSLAVLNSKVNAVVPLLLLACVPPLVPQPDVTLPQPLPDVTSLSAPEDLAVLRVPTDVMPHPAAVPA